jgi:hypothetical protein
MRRIIALAGLILAATACASPPEPEPRFPGSPTPGAPAPAPASTPAPAPAAATPAATTPLPTAANDACGAAAVQNLVGRPRTEIPVPLDPAKQRVACTTCPVTEDYQPERLNFFFDAGTGVIREIKCG